VLAANQAEPVSRSLTSCLWQPLQKEKPSGKSSFLISGSFPCREKHEDYSYYTDYDPLRYHSDEAQHYLSVIVYMFCFWLEIYIYINRQC
jgi:hypothetical protein